MKTLVICAVVLAGSFALNAGPVPTRKPPPTIRHIAVEGGDHELEVKITATEPLTPVIQIVTDPDRLIVDFPDALPGPELGSLFFDGGALRAVRVALLSATPRVTRVVLDLMMPAQHRVLSSGNATIVKLGVGVSGRWSLNDATRGPIEARPKSGSDVASPLRDRSPEKIPEKLVASRAMLRHLRVLEDNQDFELEIIADHPVVPLTQIVEDPKRLVLDFPGLFPGRELHGLAVNRPDVTGIRVGLFTSRPPVTRVVLDMNSQPQFELLPSGNSVIVKLAAKDQPSIIGVVTGGVVRPLSTPAPAMAAVPAALEAARRLRVSVRAGKLSIWADGATLSDVLYEIHRRTGADIPIPSLARNERVAVNLGPGPAPDVLAALLNGSSFNFVIVGVLGDPTLVSSVQLTQKDNRPQPRFPASPPADAPLDLSTATDSLRQPEPEPLPVSPVPVSDTPPQPLPPPLPPTPDTPPQNITR